MAITSDDVSKAILSMDVYHRGDNQSIVLPGTGPDDAIGTRIGQYEIFATYVDKAKSFYAIAYKDTVSGKIIISYRGTDNIGWLNLGSDIYQGWAIGAGQVLDNQADLAIEFYENVVQKATLDGTWKLYDALPQNMPEIEFTGHSLGGGLAGLVASLTNNEATIFDHMPFAYASYEEALTRHNGIAEYARGKSTDSFRRLSASTLFDTLQYGKQFKRF